MEQKVLIVDDAKLMRNMIKKILKEMKDVTTLETDNGESAVELYKAVKPDLVTMDITMDFKNGVEAAKEILSYKPNAKIIMITALGQEKYLHECISLGVKDFIVKPFTKERILSAIKKAL